MTLARIYYQDDAVTLWHGDALDVLGALPAGMVQGVVTDPPYATTNDGSSFVTRTAVRFLPTEDQFYESWIREHLSEWSRVCGPGGAAWLTIDWHGALAVERAASRLGLRRPSVGVWHREGLGMGHVLRHVYECFVIVPFADFQRTATDEPDLWTHPWGPGKRVTEHPAEKPIGLLRRAIRLVSQPGDTVIDPFAGAGSTVLAAVEEGRRCVAVERDEENCAVAARRLSQAVLPLPAPRPPTQLALGTDAPAPGTGEP